MDHEFRVSVHDQVGIVAREDDLTLLLGLPDKRDDLFNYGVVEIFFGLIDDQRTATFA